MTLEEAQERILALENENAELKTERDTLSQKNGELSTNLENARNLNQKLFERVSAHSSEDDEDDEPDAAPSCEDFAKTINII